MQNDSPQPRCRRRHPRPRYQTVLQATLAVQFGHCAVSTPLKRLNCLLTNFGTEQKSSRSVEVPERPPLHVRPKSSSSHKSSWIRLSLTSFTTSAPSWHAPRHVTHGTSLPSPIFTTPLRPTTNTTATRAVTRASGQGRSENHTSSVCFHSSSNSGSVWGFPV